MADDKRADVVIAGGGFAGLALALALRQGLGESFRIIVADPAFAAPPRICCGLAYSGVHEPRSALHTASGPAVLSDALPASCDVLHWHAYTS